MTVSPAAKTAACKHCGTPFHPRRTSEEFCCQGCSYVHHLIREENLDRYYELKNKPVPPVGGTVFEQRDFDWLEEERTIAESEASPGGFARKTFGLQGISCLGCVWLIEKIFKQCPGAHQIRTNPQWGRLQLSWAPGEFDLQAFARRLQRFGYLLGPADAPPQRETHTLARKLTLCAAFVLNTMLFTLPRYLGMEHSFVLAPLFELIALSFATLSLLVGGSYFITRAWESLRLGVLHIDFPIALGIVCAYLGSLYGWVITDFSLLYFDFVALFTFLMLLGRYAQEAALERNRNALLKLQPFHSAVQRVEGEGEDFRAAGELSLRDLAPGHLYQLKPGAQLPVASTLLGAPSSFSLEWITGESEPATGQSGQTLPAGARLLGAESRVFRAEESFGGSFLARLQAIPQGEAFRDLATEKVLRIYIIIILILAAVGAAAWTVFGPGIATGIQVAVSLLVVSCPCALGVAIPLLHETAVARLQKHGLFVKSPDIWPRLLAVRHLVFDKTGTLTYETPAILNPEALDELTSKVQADIYALANASHHPVSRAIRQHLLSRNPALANHRPAQAEPPAEIPACGMEATLADGARLRLGKPSWAAPDSPADTAQGDVAITRDGQLLAILRLSESVREDARTEMEALRQRGFSLHILSGDRPEKVEQMAQWLGLRPDEYHGGLQPEEKADWIQRQAPGTALMVGDGANDALAFDVSRVTGTPVIDRNLLEHRADFYFLGRGLRAIRLLFQVHRRKRQLHTRVFVFTIIYNVATGILCLAAMMNPLLAAILMPASALVSLALVALPKMPGPEHQK